MFTYNSLLLYMICTCTCTSLCIQLQLETLQQQATAAGATVSAESADTVPVSSGLSDVNTAPPATGSAGEPAPTQGILASDNQQVCVCFILCLN